MYIHQLTIDSNDAAALCDPAVARGRLRQWFNEGRRPEGGKLVDSIMPRDYELINSTIGARSVVLYAKSLNTMVAGLRSLTRVGFSSELDNGLAIFVGKYNVEREVLSHYTKVVRKFVETRDMGPDVVSFHEYAQAAERSRLFKRASYIIVSTPDRFAGVNRVGLLDDNVKLNALANVIVAMRYNMMEENLEDALPF
jgi:hypothetical protein